MLPKCVYNTVIKNQGMAWQLCGASAMREAASGSCGRKLNAHEVSTRLGVTLSPCGEVTSVMSLCHADWRGLGGKCVCVSPRHGGRET